MSVELGLWGVRSLRQGYSKPGLFVRGTSNSLPDVCPTDLPGSIQRGRPIARRIVVCIAQLDIAAWILPLKFQPAFSASTKTPMLGLFYSVDFHDIKLVEGASNIILHGKPPHQFNRLAIEPVCLPNVSASKVSINIVLTRLAAGTAMTPLIQMLPCA